MGQETLQELIEAYLKNTISDEGYARLTDLLEQENNRQIFKEYVKEDYVLKNMNREFDAENAHKRALEQIDGNERQKTLPWRTIYKYAASILVLIGLGLLAKSFITGTQDSFTDHGKIEVVLDDGTIKTIDELNDELKTDENAVYGVVNEGKLRYSTEENLANAYNTLNVPFGKKFQIVLSDGTMVHMNSGSSLRYPITFVTIGKREVFLSGEAFFKVAKDSERPYVVHANDLDIMVLGTEFNVSVYDNDDLIETTLQEGSVKVVSANSEQLLVPNEQSVWNKSNSKLEKKTVKIDQFTDWMQGKLSFRSTPFKEIIKKMERHFDVQIINNNKDLNEERFTALFEDETIEQVMSYFSKGYGFDFKIEERTITIAP